MHIQTFCKNLMSHEILHLGWVVPWDLEVCATGRCGWSGGRMVGCEPGESRPTVSWALRAPKQAWGSQRRLFDDQWACAILKKGVRWANLRLKAYVWIFCHEYLLDDALVSWFGGKSSNIGIDTKASYFWDQSDYKWEAVTSAHRWTVKSPEYDQERSLVDFCKIMI